MNTTAKDSRKAAAPSKIEESLWRKNWSKIPFLAFCWGSLFLVGLTNFLIIYLVYPRLMEISPLLNNLIIFCSALFILILFGGLTLITLSSITGLDLLYPHNKKSVTVKLLFPVAVFLGKLMRVDRNKLRVSFVKVNNSLTEAQSRRIKGDRILVLLPHCLQIDVCNRKITNDITNCVGCGKCHVGSLLDLGKKYALKIEVVNGGTLARRRVAQFRPHGIIAVACELDLTLGIQDVHPIPVYGVLNDRPYGPCFNTCVDMTLVEEAVRFFRKDLS
ncbi:hypothetical protein CHISP_2257 [Chitinispirillum alkaliphilum]|nr:hypothetical protein CHISP_2257 [Chitinispirillum alkaliphilum]